MEESRALMNGRRWARNLSKDYLFKTLCVRISRYQVRMLGLGDLAR